MSEENSTADQNSETAEPTAEEQIASLQEDVARWKAHSRKNEDRAKANASQLKEFEEWKQSQLTDTERAIEDAKAQVRAEVAAEYGGKVARTAFLAAAKGRISDPEKVLSRVDAAQFLTEDGDVDDQAIGEFLDGIAPAVTEEPAQKSPANLFQGAQGDGSALPLNGDPLLDKVMGIVGRR